MAKSLPAATSDRTGVSVALASVFVFTGVLGATGTGTSSSTGVFTGAATGVFAGAVAGVFVGAVVVTGFSVGALC